MFVSISAVRPSIAAMQGWLDLTALPFPALLTDSRGLVVAANDAACFAAGVETGRAVGLALWDCYWIALQHGQADEIRSAVSDLMTPLPATGALGKRLLPGRGILLRLEGEAPVAAALPAAALAMAGSPPDELRQVEWVASHDLHQPLRAVQISAQRLLRSGPGALGVESQQALLETIVANTRQLSQMLDDLAAWCGHAAAQAVEVPSKACVELACARLRQTGRPVPGIEYGEPLPRVSAQPEGLVTVFEHLLSNACQNRAAEREPRVVINAARAGGAWLFCVRDNGQGFEPGHREKLFRLFYRVSPSGPGRGLGLALSRRIVESWNGAIWAESEFGNGAAIWFTVPALREERTSR